MRRTGFSPLTRQMVLDRAADRMGFEACEICGVHPVEQLHHRRARAAGGTRRASTNSAANALGLCEACHSVVEGRSVVGPFGDRIRGSRADSQANGWLLTQRQEPTDIPVLTATGREYFDDLGHRREVL